MNPLDALRGHDFTVFVNDARELAMRLEAGHRVEYTYKGRYIICEKRGKEYVTVEGESEKGAQEQWKRIHEDGYYYDWRRQQRVAIPGAR